jgi:formylglycine-generating enzyme required for sulfatase activity
MKTFRFGVVVLASMLSSSLCMALALVMAMGMASVKADTIQEGFPPFGNSGLESGWLPQFNPTNGQLTNVALMFNGSISGQVWVYNPTPTGTPFTINNISGALGRMWVSNSSFEVYGTCTGGGPGGYVGPYTGTQVIGGGFFNGSAQTSQAADINFFTGTNSVFVYVDADSFSPTIITVNPTFLQGGWMTMGGGGQIMNAEITYFYTPTPTNGPTPPDGIWINPSGSGYAISWPASATNLVLMTTTNLAPAVSWAIVTNALQTNGAMYSVQIDGNQPCQFFRLIQNTATPDGMALIPAGSFTMGDVADTNLYGDAAPISVTVSAFYMDTNLVSYSQWQSVYNWATTHGYGFDHAGSGKAPNHPVQTVNWWDTVKWCNARSQQASLAPVYYTDAGLTQVYTNGEVNAVYPNWSANGYRLPTEAEWEKAARGGLYGKRFPWGDTISESQANYIAAPGSYFYDVNTYVGNNTNYNTGGTPYTSPVGSFAPNGYGLYDMAGNVGEWCWDWYAIPYAGGSDPHGPAGPVGNRVLRGGWWSYYADYARCGCRNAAGPQGLADALGFRCVRGQ